VLLRTADFESSVSSYSNVRIKSYLKCRSVVHTCDDTPVQITVANRKDWGGAGEGARVLLRTADFKPSVSSYVNVRI
jgi:hypothetical protein